MYKNSLKIKKLENLNFCNFWVALRKLPTINDASLALKNVLWSFSKLLSYRTFNLKQKFTDNVGTRQHFGHFRFSRTILSPFQPKVSKISSKTYWILSSIFGERWPTFDQIC